MTAHLCYACGREITVAPFIPFDNRTYHSGCFVCHSCNKPLGNAPFRVVEDQPYHLECLHSQSLPRCAGCGNVILADRVIAFDRVWHPEHFACGHCRRPFTSSDICEENGVLYCARCHKDLFAPHCAVCSGPIIGPYVQNMWGDVYCSFHEQEFSLCSCCKRLVCDPITKGGYRYGDGRTVCTLCRMSGVDDLKTAWPAFNKVKRNLARLGVDLINTPIPLELADQKQIAALAYTQSAGDMFGFTLKVGPGRQNDRMECGVKKISILYGLPWELFTAVAAHELGHVWLCLNKVFVDRPEVEEGFCELLGYLWLEGVGTPSSKCWRDDMLVNPNAIFANGLQRALRSYRTYSLSHLMTHLRSTSRFP